MIFDCSKIRGPYPGVVVEDGTGKVLPEGLRVSWFDTETGEVLVNVYPTQTILVDGREELVKERRWFPPPLTVWLLL